MSSLKIKLLTLAGLSMALLGTSANASLIFYGTYYLPSPLGDPATEASWVSSTTGTSPLVDLTKIPSSGGGAVPSSSFSIRDGGGGTFVAGTSTTAEVKWDLTGTGYELRYVLLKDGAVCAPGDSCAPTGRDKKKQLYSLWEVTADQRVSSDWEDIFFGLLSGGVLTNIDKGISHVTFMGTRGGTTKVPEPGVLLLLGSGLLVLGASGLRRRRATRG